MVRQWLLATMVGTVLGCTSGGSPAPWAAESGIVADGALDRGNSFERDGGFGMADAAASALLSRVSFDPAQGKTVETPSGARVRFTANTLVTASGAAPVGQVTATLDHVVHKGSGPEDMPGGFTATDATGATVDLVSFGAIDVDLADEAGNAVNLASGATATITIPALAAGPPSVPLWYLPDGASTWVEEGSATLQGGSYVGEVSHSTPWNADAPIPPTCPRGCIESYLQGEPGDRYTLRLVKDTCDIFADKGVLTGVVLNSNGEFKIDNLMAGATYRVQRVGHADRGIVTVPPSDATECGVVEWHADYVITLTLTNSGNCPANRAVDVHWTVVNEPPGGKYPNYFGTASTGQYCGDFYEPRELVLGALYGDATVTIQMQNTDTGALVGPVLHKFSFTVDEPILEHALGSFSVP